MVPLGPTQLGPSGQSWPSPVLVKPMAEKNKMAVLLGNILKSDPHQLTLSLTYIRIHYIWHSISHILWHSIWHSLKHIFGHSIWHSIWHSVWHSIDIYCDTLSGILWGIFSDIPSGILFGILSGICSDILSGILCGILSGIYSDIRSGILSGILSSILSDILSGMCSGPSVPSCIQSWRGDTSVKSRDPHLAGGEWWWYITLGSQSSRQRYGSVWSNSTLESFPICCVLNWASKITKVHSPGKEEPQVELFTNHG